MLCQENNDLNYCTYVCIENVNCIKYLGLYYIDSRLKWKNYIEHLISLSRKLFCIFRYITKVHSVHDKIQLRIIYISLVQLVNIYGIERWG